VRWGTKCPSARAGRLLERMVVFTESVGSSSPLPSLLARRPTSQAPIPSSSSAVRGVMRHKVSRDTDTPDDP
jgi:hypothetical protein